MSETLSIAMDEAEKMVDLKKAYADMILNTAKEAGARVLAAEWRARNCEHDQLYTKEEAIRMLLRLKQMIDAKGRDSSTTFTYAFSRKRKKGWLSDLGGNCFSGESYTKRSLKEQSNIGFVPKTVGFVNESLNDSRGLVQVAHQLISLSGKKWQ